LVPALVGAIVWAHAGNRWVFTAPGGGWEYPLFLVIASVALVLIGDVAFALGRRARRWPVAPGASRPLIEGA
jgi:putative oxidoreductase